MHFIFKLLDWCDCIFEYRNTPLTGWVGVVGPIGRIGPVSRITKRGIDWGRRLPAPAVYFFSARSALRAFCCLNLFKFMTDDIAVTVTGA